MSTRVALILAALVALFFAIDLSVDGGWTLFLLRKFVDMVDWLMFWR